ncbi:MAG: hypothetical protein H6581_09075 [Bacteroidia bacterium]|nr:hypothetical protein [Bacteroidia bacterium]
MKSFTQITLFALLTTLFSCQPPASVHLVQLTLTYPDAQTETVTLDSNATLFINLGDQQFLIRANEINATDAKVEILNTSATADSTTNSVRLARLGSERKSLVPGQQFAMQGSGRGNITVVYEPVAIDGGSPEQNEKGVCHGNKECCTASCYSTLCCTGGDGPCRNAKCDCKPSGNCPGGPSNPTPNPPVVAFEHLSVLDFTLLFDPSKTSLEIPVPGTRSR